jgi:hypothetical protein
MEWTISIDDKLFERVKKIAESRGSTVEGFIREYIENLAANADWEEEFVRLSGQGHSNGWRFNRDEIHDRKL